MRFSTKMMAAAAALMLSVAAQAASWTGSISGVKVTYSPDAGGAGYHSIVLSGTGSSCNSPATGTMVYQTSNLTTDQDILKALYDFLLNAKSASANVTINYDVIGTCYITSWSRN